MDVKFCIHFEHNPTKDEGKVKLKCNEEAFVVQDNLCCISISSLNEKYFEIAQQSWFHKEKQCLQTSIKVN